LSQTYYTGPVQCTGSSTKPGGPTEPIYLNTAAQLLSYKTTELWSFCPPSCGAGERERERERVHPSCGAGERERQ
jgi:hypothetical protein